MSADVLYWTLLDITHCGHCPFRHVTHTGGTVVRCAREGKVKRIDEPYKAPPEWCPLRKEQVIVRVAGDTRLP
jgi:hypothetical protein